MTTPEEAIERIEFLIQNAESNFGSTMYCKVTTFELRKALGQDVSTWGLQRRVESRAMIKATANPFNAPPNETMMVCPDCGVPAIVNTKQPEGTHYVIDPTSRMIHMVICGIPTAEPKEQ